MCSMSYMYMPGATAVGITYHEGVVFASERRIAYGNFLVSKSTKKTFQITPKVGAACAGLVADMQILSLQISALAKIVLPINTSIMQVASIFNFID